MERPRRIGTDAKVRLRQGDWVSRLDRVLRDLSVMRVLRQLQVNWGVDRAVQSAIAAGYGSITEQTEMWQRHRVHRDRNDK